MVFDLHSIIYAEVFLIMRRSTISKTKMIMEAKLIIIAARLNAKKLTERLATLALALTN